MVDRTHHCYIAVCITGDKSRQFSLWWRQLSIVAEGLNSPTGVAVARDGRVYVANNGVCPSFPLPIPECPGTGEVVRLNRLEADDDDHHDDGDHHGNDHHEGTRRVEDQLH